MRSRQIYGVLYSDIHYPKFISLHMIGIPGTRTKKDMAGKRWSALLLVVLLILESTVATFHTVDSDELIP